MQATCLRIPLHRRREKSNIHPRIEECRASHRAKCPLRLRKNGPVVWRIWSSGRHFLGRPRPSASGVSDEKVRCARAPGRGTPLPSRPQGDHHRAGPDPALPEAPKESREKFRRDQGISESGVTAPNDRAEPGRRRFGAVILGNGHLPRRRHSRSPDLAGAIGCSRRPERAIYWPRAGEAAHTVTTKAGIRTLAWQRPGSNGTGGPCGGPRSRARASGSHAPGRQLSGPGPWGLDAREIAPTSPDENPLTPPRHTDP